MPALASLKIASICDMVYRDYFKALLSAIPVIAGDHEWNVEAYVITSIKLLHILA